MSQATSNAKRYYLRRKNAKVPAPARYFESVSRSSKAPNRKRRFSDGQPRDVLSETPIKKLKVFGENASKNKICHLRRKRLFCSHETNAKDHQLETPSKKRKAAKNESVAVQDSNNKSEKPNNTELVEQGPGRHRQKRKETKLTKLMQTISRKDRFLRKYKQQGLIGQGSFGKVYAGIRNDDGLPVAIKYVPIQSITHHVRVKTGDTIPAEIFYLKKLDHLNVIKLLSHYEIENNHVIVMERPRDGTSLFNYMTKKGGSLSEEEVKKITRQLIPAAMYLEEMGVIHNDLKTENILMDEDAGQVKIIDFGLACKLSCDPIHRFVGTRTHCPPEYATESEYFGAEATVWSLGCVMYDLLTGELPYRDEHHACWSPLKMPGYLSQGASDFVSRMLDKNRQNRATLEELLQHHWIQDD